MNLFLQPCGGGRKAVPRQIKQIVRILIMAIITTSVLTACGVRPEEKEQRAKEALERKYNREFEITAVYPQKFGELYYEVQAYAADDPLVRFTAAVDTEDDNISDSYPEQRVCAAISRKAEENLDGLPGIYYVRTHAVGPQPITDDADISIQDYAALDPLNLFRIEIYVTPEQSDTALCYKALSQLYHELECLTGTGRLFVINEEQMQAVQTYFDANDERTHEYTMLTQDFFFLDINYEKGVIGMTEQAFADAVKGVF